ncbi:hypothetical protein ABGB18_27665 [Nonomuraea sp. B12E4]|uniref:hypothetical protein n=1 Tax=Nonomuraea sp. B12E4 TaxID=3153564 RepID=UPI00325ED5F4
MSAIVLALGLAGAGVTPFVVQSANASAAYDPVEPCDVGEVCDAVPETTVTITTTTTLDTPSPEQPLDTPETTITKTVTAKPTKPTKSPTPTRTSSPPPISTPSSTPTQNLQPLPTQSIEVPPTSSSPEPSVELPAVATSQPVPSATPSETEAASTEAVLELRQAAPEFDQRTLTQQLSIPALVLVLLALFAVLIFEGRLRRMAHAAAVRKAGPQAGRPDMPSGGGYPAGPGYAAAAFPAPGYPGGTAYAPIISFVPVQTYPSGQAQYGAVYHDQHPYPHQGYMEEPPAPEAPPEPMVLHPDDFDSYSEPPEPKAREFRDPFEPVIQPSETPSSEIPPGGASPYDDDTERPFGAPAAWAESGDSEPWQQSTGRSSSLFEPGPKPGLDDGPRDYDPPPYVAADTEATAVQPLPDKPDAEPAAPEKGGTEPTKEMPDSKRRRWGRKK